MCKPKQVTAKVFMSGPSQAVRLPQAYRFDCETVTIRRQGGSLILTPVAETWDDLCHGDPDDIEELLDAALDAILVTHNTREFARVPELAIDTRISE